ncbi:DUF6177 family protein [Microbacterium sp. RD1]|uniref:DUF6177 family protein n=1 Tax=Microbacterium sp. RD1 TaxID=3457313 RepID=UPI003FA54277
MSADHPLVDGAGEHWVLTETRADVLALTQGMSDLLGRTAAEGRRPLVVSGEYARMTQPLAEALSAVHGHWVVRTTADGCYDTRTGAALDSPPDVLDLPPHPSRDGVHPAFLRATISNRLHLVVTASTRHRVSRPVRLGGVLESIAQETTGAPPEHWGALEPMLAGWDRDDLTERSRRRMPTDSRWAAVSSGAHPLVATLAVARTSEGLEETTRVWVDADDARGTVGERGRQLLAAAATIGMPLMGVAFAAIGSPDLARRPTASPPPEPLALLVGPPGIRALGVDAVKWTGDVGGATVGSPRLPGVLIPLGSVDGGGWQRLAEVLAPLDRERVWRMLGLAPFLASALLEREGGS